MLTNKNTAVSYSNIHSLLFLGQLHSKTYFCIIHLIFHKEFNSLAVLLIVIAMLRAFAIVNFYNDEVM